MVLCILGIVGVSWIPMPGAKPKPLLQAMTDRIHLGLDLRGGAHLILQVKVEEAVNADTDNTVALIKQELNGANLSYSQVYKPDPAKASLIRVEGTPADKSNDARVLLEAKYGNTYDVAAGDEPGSGAGMRSIPAAAAEILKARYGTRAPIVARIAAGRPELAEPLSRGCPAIAAEVVHAVGSEMARSIGDFLIRRTSLSWRSPVEAEAAAPAVARLMAAELGWDRAREDAEVASFTHEQQSQRTIA